MSISFSTFSKLDTVVYLHNGIGDLIMAFPVLEALRTGAHDPGRVLVWVKCPVTFELMRLAGYTALFEVRILNRRWAPLQALLLRLRRVETVLAPQACGDWRMPFMAWLTGAGVRVGRENPLGQWGFNRVLPHYDRQRLHKTRFYLQVTAAAGFVVPREPRLPRVRPSEAARLQWRDRFGLTEAGAQLLTIAPGSSAGETHKRWPAAHYGRLVRLALERNAAWRCALFGGVEETALLEGVKSAAGAEVARRIHLVTERELDSALAVLSESVCVVTNCNGPAHMAALVGAPLVSLYGPTNAGNTAAFTPDLRVVSRGFACSPCYRHEFLRGCGQPVCMAEISPESVLVEVERCVRGDKGSWAVWRDTTAAMRPVKEGLVPRYAH